MEIVKKYFPWVAAVIIAVAAVLITTSITNTERTNSEQRMQHITDSLYQVKYADSMAYITNIAHIDSMYRVSKAAVESLTTVIQYSKKENKVYIKTVYKDSIREVYVDNSEMLVNYQNSIKKLEDSLATVQVSRVDTFIQYVDRVMHDTIIQYSHVDDTISIEKTIRPVKTFAIYADGTFVYDLDNNKHLGAEVGGKLFVKGPVYVKGAVTYDGTLGVAAGIGGELDF